MSMFRSLFGKGKKRDNRSDSEETIQSARAGDVVVVSGFAPALEDAYFVIEKRSRYQSPVGQWYELVAADGEWQVGIEWSDFDGLYIAITEQGNPVGLAALNLSDEDMANLDAEHSIDNFVTYEETEYFYRNSYEATYFADETGSGDKFYLWEFSTNDGTKNLSVVKAEDTPFEVYFSQVIDPKSVSVYRQ